MELTVSFPWNLERNVTTVAPHMALKLIAWGKLTFDERVVLHRAGADLFPELGSAVVAVRLERVASLDRESWVRGQGSGVRGQGSGVRGQGLGVRG